jgi:gluconate 2-dehydrogenase alpha chain
MVTRLKDVDAVTIGLGWTGAIMARELTKAGLNVVSLEKGQDRIPGEDFILPAVRDEVRYAQRLELMWDNSLDTLTFRNFANEQALPIRRIGASCRRISASAARSPSAMAQTRFPTA